MITNAQIRTFRNELLHANDDTGAEWCDIALAYSETADSQGNELRDPFTGAIVTRTDARNVVENMLNDADFILDNDGLAVMQLVDDE